jgi:TPR repeat protein
MFTTAAEQGYLDAQNNLGYMYVNGKRVCQDDKKAVHWFRKAVQGNANAQLNLAILLSSTERVKELLKTTRRRCAGLGKQQTKGIL